MSRPHPLDYEPPRQPIARRPRDYFVACYRGAIVFVIVLVGLGAVVGQAFDRLGGFAGYLPSSGILLFAIAAGVATFRATLHPR